MNKKWMLFLTMMLAVCLLLVGCNRGMPEDQVADIEQRLVEAETVSGRLESNLAIEVDNQKYDLDFNADTQMDFSKDFPIIDLEGNVAVMGIKADFEVFLNEQLLYFKAMGEEEVMEMDEDIRQKINTARQSEVSDAIQASRRITREYENKNQLLILDYDVAEVNEQVRRMLQGGSPLLDEEFTTSRSKDDNPQFVLDKCEVVYVVDRANVLQEIRGEVSYNVFYEDELVAFQLNFTYQVDQLAGDLDMQEPSYTTTTWREKTQTTEQEPVAEEGQQKRKETDEVQQSTQSEDKE